MQFIAIDGTHYNLSLLVSMRYQPRTEAVNDRLREAYGPAQYVDYPRGRIRSASSLTLKCYGERPIHIAATKQIQYSAKSLVITKVSLRIRCVLNLQSDEVGFPEPFGPITILMSRSFSFSMKATLLKPLMVMSSSGGAVSRWSA
jgi:hypothetical protein